MGGPRPAGDLDEPDHDAARTSERVRGAHGALRGGARKTSTRRPRPTGTAPPPPGQTGAYNSFWLDRGLRTNQTSLIVDPPDGRYPARTERVRESDAGVRGVAERHGVRHVRGPEPLRPVHHARHAGLDDPRLLQPQLPDPADARARRDLRGDDPRRTHHPAGTDAPTCRCRSASGWAIRAPAGKGDTLVVETANLTPKGDERVRNLVRAGSERAHVVERFTRVAADRIDYRFTVTDPGDLRAPVDGGDSDGAPRGRGLRVRLPRGQPTGWRTSWPAPARLTRPINRRPRPATNRRFLTTRVPAPVVRPPVAGHASFPPATATTGRGAPRRGRFPRSPATV